MTRGRAWLCLLAVVACSAASTATVPNLQGTYELYLVNGTNGCDLPGLTEGQVTPAVPLFVSQNATIQQNMTGCLSGAAVGLLGATTDAGDACPPVNSPATAALLGTVGGNSVTLVTEGVIGAGCDGGPGCDAAADAPVCAYTTNASLNLNFVASTVQGTLTYTITNTIGPGCKALGGCQSVQAVAGVLAVLEAGADAAVEGGSDAGTDATVGDAAEGG